MFVTTTSYATAVPVEVEIHDGAILVQIAPLWISQPNNQNQSIYRSLLTLFRYLSMRRTATSHTAVGKCDTVCLFLRFLSQSVGLFWHISVCGRVGLFWYVWISFDTIEIQVWVTFDTVHIPQYAARCNLAHRYMENAVILKCDLVGLFPSFLSVCVGLFWHCSHTAVCGALQLRAQIYGSIMP